MNDTRSAQLSVLGTKISLSCSMNSSIISCESSTLALALTLYTKDNFAHAQCPSAMFPVQRNYDDPQPSNQYIYTEIFQDDFCSPKLGKTNIFL